MNTLTKYKILEGQLQYNEWMTLKGFRVNHEYVCVGFTKNPGTLPPSIHLINMNGTIVECMYSDDRFSIVED